VPWEGTKCAIARYKKTYVPRERVRTHGSLRKDLAKIISAKKDIRDKIISDKRLSPKSSRWQNNLGQMNFAHVPVSNHCAHQILTLSPSLWPTSTTMLLPLLLSPKWPFVLGLDFLPQFDWFSVQVFSVQAVMSGGLLDSIRIFNVWPLFFVTVHRKK
jgi:hypothetical protein